MYANEPWLPQQQRPPLIADQIISFIFALTIYDEFDDNSMVTFVSATMTMSHYYSDIGTTEVVHKLTQYNYSSNIEKNLSNSGNNQ